MQLERGKMNVQTKIHKQYASDSMGLRKVRSGKKAQKEKGKSIEKYKNNQAIETVKALTRN